MPQLETLRNGKRAAVLEALRKGNTRRAACALGGIDPTTLYAWMHNDPSLSNAVKEAEAEAERYFVSKVQEATCENWTAAAWWLERRRRDDYGRNEKLTVVQGLAKDVKALSDEQLAELAYGRDADTPDGA